MLLKTTDRIFNPLLFQILMIVVLAFVQIPIVHYVYGGYIKYVLLFGLLIIGWQFFRKNMKYVVEDKASIVALCFALFYLVTIALNFNLALSVNIKQLVYMIVIFIMFFANQNNDNGIYVISKTIFWVTFVLSAFSIVVFFLNITEWYIFDIKYFIGNGESDRFWGLYNPNTCGAIAVISILVSFFLLDEKKDESLLKRGLKLFFVGFNVIVQFFLMVISGSRGAYYSFLFVIVAVVFVFVVKNFHRESIPAYLRTIIALVICVVTVAIVVGISTFIQLNKTGFPFVSINDANNPDMDTSLENTIENFLEKYAEESSVDLSDFNFGFLSFNGLTDVATGRSISDTTGRLGIWRAGIKVFLEHPIFGWTHEGFVDEVNNYAGEFNFMQDSVVYGGLHNIYITILCSSGLVGFVCFIIIVAIVLSRFFKLFISDNEIDKKIILSLAVCLYFLVSEIVESRILYTVSFFNVVFWFYFGYLNYSCVRNNNAIGEKI